jgi:hypothetical protein
MIVRAHNKTGQFYDLQNNPVELPEGYAPYKAPTQVSRQKMWMSYPDDKSSDPAHLVFFDPKDPTNRKDASTGEDVPKGAKAVDEAAALAKLRQQAWGTGELNTMTKAIEMMNDPDADPAAQWAAEQVVTAHLKKNALIGAQKTTERPMVVGGEVKAVPFQSGPVSAPIPAIPGQSSPTPSPVQNQHPAPAVAPPRRAPGATAAPASPAAAVQAPAVAAQRARDIGIPPAQYNKAQEGIRAISAASVPVFGDPTQPGLTSLQDYSDLARDPASVSRIAAATRLVGMLRDNDLTDAHASVSTGGINLGLGPLAEIIQNQAGVPKQIAEQRAKMTIDALKSMTPREREYYNALLSAKEGIVGLRKATTGSGAKYAVDAMASTLPRIGDNVVDEAGYKDLMKRQAGIFVDASRGHLKNAFTPEQRQVFDRLAAMNSGAPQKAPIPIVDTQADYDKVPVGALYIDKSDGKQYTKGKKK